jgi:hypothetical protein
MLADFAFRARQITTGAGSRQCSSIRSAGVPPAIPVEQKPSRIFPFYF